MYTLTTVTANLAGPVEQVCFPTATPHYDAQAQSNIQQVMLNCEHLGNRTLES